jgi:hypothetical protein
MSDYLADVDPGKAYPRAHTLLCREPQHLLCGIILYIDKIATDRHGHLLLEPVYFTLTMFKEGNPLGPLSAVLLASCERHAPKGAVTPPTIHTAAP